MTVFEIINKIRNICKNNGFLEIFEQINKERLMSRTHYEFQNESCNFSANEVITNTSDVRENLSILAHSQINDTTLENYTLLDNALARPGHNLILLSDSNMGRVQLLKYFAAMNNFSITDLSDMTFSTTHLLKDVIYDVYSKVKPQIIEFRLTESNFQVLQFLINVVIKEDFLNVFSQNEISEIIQTYLQKKDDHLTDVEIRSSLKDLRYILKTKCHIVVIPYCSLPNSRLFKEFDLVRLHIPLQQQIVNNYCEIESLRPILLNIGEQVEQYLPFINNNLFYDFVTVFSKIYSENNEKHSKTTQSINTVMDFIEKEQNRQKALEEEIEKISPQIEELKLARENTINQKKQELEEIETKKQQILNEKEAKEKDLAEKKEMIDYPQRLLVQQAKIVKDQKDSLLKYDENELLPMRLLADEPTRELRRIFEVIGLLMLVEDTNFDTFGKNLLKSDNLLLTLIEKINENEISLEVVNTIKDLISDDNFSADNLSKQVPCLGTIRKYIDSIIKYSTLNNEVQQKKKEIDTVTKQLDDYIKSTETQLGEYDQKIEELQQEEPISDLEQSYNSKLRKIESLSRILSCPKLFESWKNYLNTKNDVIVGNSVLMALFVVYCCTVPQEISDQIYCK